VARPHGLRLPKPRRVLAALSDERLVERVRQGDAVAFEVLYDRHHRGILAFSRHMLRSADEAEDAVQHTFISAYNDLQRSAERDIRFKAWLYTIARNRCLSILRARREQASDEIELTVDRLSDDVQHRADLQALLSDIATLPEDQREALVLSEVGDLSHVEVAAVIGCEAAKVKSLVFQARTALMDRKQARETPCEEIREQLATLRGGALRRSHLRHHLASCPGCAQYRDEVKRQRQMLAVALPVIPSLALKHNVLAAVGVGGGTAGGAAVGTGLGIAAKSGLAKVGIAAAIAVGGAGTAMVATQGVDSLPVVGTESGSHDGASGGGGQGGGGGAAGVAAPGTGTSATGTDTTASDLKSRNRSESGKEHGFTPTSGESNGEAAREFAATRGKGTHKGLSKAHKTKTRVKKARRHRHVKKVRVKKVAPQPVTPQRTRTQPTKTQSQPAPRDTTTTTTPTTSTPTTTTTTTTSPTPPDGGGNGKGTGRIVDAPQ
jgi:RNA polymerase sigma factor (sigma-70 family)